MTETMIEEKKKITHRLIAMKLQPTRDLVHRPQGLALRGNTVIYQISLSAILCRSPILLQSLLQLLPFSLPLYYYLNSILYSFRDPFPIISLFYSHCIPYSYHMTYSPIPLLCYLAPMFPYLAPCTFSELLYNKLYLVVILQFVN